MSDEEKKDISDPQINYRTDHAEQEVRKKEAANAKTNKAKGIKPAEIGDATGGEVRSQKEHLIEGKERKGKSMAERFVKGKKPSSTLSEIKEVNEISTVNKDLHLKSTTSLTDPETAKQNLKGTSKLGNTGTKTPTFRGRGGAPITKDPSEIIREKQKLDTPNDIISKNESGKQQKQEPQHKPTAQESRTTQNLSARERTNMAKEAKEQQVQKVDKTVEVEKDVKQIGIRERIAKAIIEKSNPQRKTPAGKGKGTDLAMNKATPPSTKPIKR
jgi:hypothetical protein